MTKILYLTPGCFDKGGISRYCRYQIDALRAIIGSEELFTMSLMGYETDSFEDDFEVDYAGKSNSKWEQIKFAFLFIWVVLLKRPKVIHVAHVNFSGLSHFMAKLIGATSVLNIYGLEVWSGLSLDANWGLRNVDFIISDCHNTKKYLVDHKIRKENDIEVIWDCIDLKKFKPESENKICEVAKKYSLPLYKTHKVIMTLGRLSYSASHKGYHRLIEAFSLLNIPNSILVICGKGDMVEELIQYSKQKGISNCIYFTGMIHEDDMASLYSYADIFSLVSEVGFGKGEGIPLTPLEAMACGTPIVVGNQDGSQEAIFDNNSNGYIVDSHDIFSQVISYRSLLNNPSEQVHKGAQAINVARKNFSYEIFLAKHRSFFDSKSLIN